VFLFIERFLLFRRALGFEVWVRVCLLGLRLGLGLGLGSGLGLGLGSELNVGRIKMAKVMHVISIPMGKLQPGVRE
jgi:hypothetical protein